jgi:hypothetical protein
MKKLTGIQKYHKSAKGKAALARANKKYRSSAKGKEMIKRYLKKNAAYVKMYAALYFQRRKNDKKSKK